VSELWWPQTVRPIAKISKVKGLALILLISVFSLPSLHFLSITSEAVVLLDFFYSQPYNEMLSSVVNLVALAALSLIVTVTTVTCSVPPISRPMAATHSRVHTVFPV